MTRESAIGRRRARMRIPAFRAWLTSTIFLATAVPAAFVVLLLREPLVVVRDAPIPPAPPPSGEILAEAERLLLRSESLSERLQRLRQDVSAYACPSGTSPTDSERFQQLRQEAANAAGPTGSDYRI